MVKWFILSFIALIFLAANAAAFNEQLSFDAKIIAVITINLFILSLVLIWLASYYQKFRSAGLGIFGHAAVYLSGGIGLMGLGLHSVLTGNCNFLIGHERIPSMLNKLAMQASEYGFCSLLALLLISFGLLLLWPSLKLFYGLASQFTGPC